jgi:dipeptidyl aminopeptidase/acylaminoacyl peptidase
MRAHRFVRRGPLLWATLLLSSATSVIVVILVSAGALMLASTKPAEAAFPGSNGKIYFYHNASSSVWSMNPDGTGKTELLGTDSVDSETNPAVSPDGARIAYVYANNDIHVMNADGGGVKRITTDGNDNQDPAWSPDNKRIVFSGRGAQNKPDLFVVNSDGTGRRNLTNTPNISESDPAWSPDGSQIAYTQFGCDAGYGWCVYVMAANGTQHKNLTYETSLTECPNQPGYSHLGSSYEPNWSPDKSQNGVYKIVFTGTVVCPNSRGWDIWVMNADGTSKKNLTNDNDTSDRHPVFSPDYKQIAFQRDGDIYTMQVEDPTNLVNITNTAGTVTEESPDWAPTPRGGNPPAAVSIPYLDFTEETRPREGACRYLPNQEQRLRFLSVDSHNFFNGNTRIHGTIEVRGTPGDRLQSLVLEIVKEGRVIRANLAAGARQALLRPFPADGRLRIAQRQLLFELPSAQAAQFDTDTNDVLTLRVVATTQRGATTTRTYGYTPVSQLVLYDGNNRYFERNEAEGGDGWVLPVLNQAAQDLANVNPRNLWGDFSNMNGGAICPHKGHQEGREVDGDANWYDARDAATADALMARLRDPNHGTRIRTIIVTFGRQQNGQLRTCEPNGTLDNGAHDAFSQRIRNQRVPAPGGGTRLVSTVIRPANGHCGHFHVEFFPN